MSYNTTYTRLVADAITSFVPTVPAIQDNVTLMIGPVVKDAQNKEQPSKDFNAIIQALLNNEKFLNDLVDTLKKRQIISGDGLTGGGDLSADRTLKIVSKTDGIKINTDDIELKTVSNINDNTVNTSTTLPVSASVAKMLFDNKFDKTGGLISSGVQIYGPTNSNTGLLTFRTGDSITNAADKGHVGRLESTGGMSISLHNYIGNAFTRLYDNGHVQIKSSNDASIALIPSDGTVTITGSELTGSAQLWLGNTIANKEASIGTSNPDGSNYQSIAMSPVNNRIYFRAATVPSLMVSNSNGTVVHNVITSNGGVMYGQIENRQNLWTKGRHAIFDVQQTGAAWESGILWRTASGDGVRASILVNGAAGDPYPTYLHMGIEAQPSWFRIYRDEVLVNGAFRIQNGSLNLNGYYIDIV